MAIPSNLSYGTVVGRFLAFSSDGPDSDIAPDEVAASGTITFVCSAGALLDSEGLSAIITSDIVCTLDSEGYLCGPNGERGVQLYATDDPNAQPSGWTWTAIFDLTTPDGTPLRYLTTKPFLLPANTTVDLFYALPVAKSNGVHITRGEKGDKGDKGDQGSTGLSTSLTIIDTVTGPETAGATGPQGPQGLKGDPGGFNSGTSISATTDLNTLMTAGIYHAVGGNVDTVRNYPMTNNAPFLLKVFNGSSNSGIQIGAFHTGTRAGKVEYRRTWSNSGAVWTAWERFSSSRVDQTAGRAIYQWDDVNNREQVIYSDTGVRNIAELFPEIGTSGGNAPYIYIRRQGTTVSLWGSRMGLSTGRLITANQIPAGFRPPVYTSCAASLDVDTTSAWLGRVMVRDGTTDQFKLRFEVATGGTWYFFNMQYQTIEAWPTTLPGVAVGTIPNA